MDWFLKKVLKVINFNQKAWLRPKKKKQKSDLEADFIKLINNAGFGNCDQAQRYETCNNWSKKELFSIRTKLS